MWHVLVHIFNVILKQPYEKEYVEGTQFLEEDLENNQKLDINEILLPNSWDQLW